MTNRAHRPVSRLHRGRAKALRRDMTNAERFLWFMLRGHRLVGLSFRRQVPIGRYIVDFYCAELKLVIELDGTHHRSPGTDEYDDRRTKYPRQLGIHVAAEAVVALANLRDLLLERMRVRLGTWSPAPVAAWLFGDVVPVSYQLSPLNALGNEAVIETLELSVGSMEAESTA